MTKTFRLDTNIDSELGFTLIALSSSLKNYRLCYYINKSTGLSLIHGKEDYYDHKQNLKNKSKVEMDYHILIESRKAKQRKINHYPTYRYCNALFDFEYYLLGNKSVEGSILIPEMANFDYFLLVKHFICEADKNLLLNQLKSIPDVMIAKEIDPISLKSKENLIF